MVFHLLYRPAIGSDLIADKVDVDNFADLFTAAECRAMMDVCRMCSILTADRNSALGSIRSNAYNVLEVF